MIREYSLFLFFQFLTVVCQVETVTAEHGFRSIGNTHHMKFQSVFHFQFLLLTTNLFDQATSYRTDTANKRFNT